MLTFTNQATGERIAHHLPGDEDPFSRQGAIVAITSFSGSVATWRVTGPTEDGVIPVVRHETRCEIPQFLRRADPIEEREAPEAALSIDVPKPPAPELDDSPWEVAAREMEAARQAAGGPPGDEPVATPAEPAAATPEPTGRPRAARGRKAAAPKAAPPSLFDAL